MRALRLLFTYLAVGLCASVVVAWSLAAWAGSDRLSDPIPAPPSEWPTPYPLPAGITGPDVSYERTGPAAVLQLHFEGPPPDRIGCVMYAQIVGFPFHCLASYDMDLVQLDVSGVRTASSWRSGLPIPRWLQRGPDRRSLPIVPLPAGLALNTAVFGVLAFLLDACRNALVAARRRRSGRCPSCGHRLAQSLVCPECGTPDRHREDPLATGGQ